MEEEKTCQCQPHWFWKWTYRLLLILLVFLILNLLFAIWDIKREIKEINQREEKRDYTSQDWIEIFNQIGEAFEEENRRMKKEEKIQQWKIEHMRLKPGETSRYGLTKEDIKRMLKNLGYWDK